MGKKVIFYNVENMLNDISDVEVREVKGIFGAISYDVYIIGNNGKEVLFANCFTRDTANEVEDYLFGFSYLY